ncbi:Soluble pyridine nucleotide transhydrogenase [Symmachiella dynata]|uniref:Soluble pyridine nucleotide transhydrogenase n=1 Tax=Symmachiella dynata TaxID=2527995 RepID=A0A517ZI15_9PLAN|nr:FAD-dependent oxidoreductase [Symmachiella dynata]QDU42111.1 Soluble pyridine nucleotide transhydrogenase [Symmachiella dynata]
MLRRQLLFLATLICLLSTTTLHAAKPDVVVIGGTPGGITAAIAAGRAGRNVTLVEYHDHVGGMMTGGLGKSDIEHREMVGGIFTEYIARVREHYIRTYGRDHENVKKCRDGYYYEPSVAEAVLEKMLREVPTITVLKGWRLKSATVTNNRLVAVEIVNRKSDELRTLEAKVFIDSTYEGDLYAAAGAKFRIGRESREEFNEPHAGVIYFDYQNKTILPGTTGAADDRLPAYTYRLCLTTDPENAHPLTEPPADYDRANYLGYFDDLKAGRLDAPKSYKPGRGYNPAHFGTLVRALSVTEIPNNKSDVNINPRPLGFPFPEENAGYVEGDDETRQRIRARHRNLALGLLWFLQNDDEVPAAHRKLANQLHLAKDEFADNGHFPFQLYVREARRLIGEYTLTEHDITGDGQDNTPRHHDDSIAVGEFPIDSFPCRKRQPGDTIVLEGYLGMLDHITRPYEIPYRIMIPQTIDGLIVPVAASTTHVGFSSIRMEPTWMALGQAAGAAADLAVEKNVAPRAVPVEQLQDRLAQQGQVLRHTTATAPHPKDNPLSPVMLKADWVPDDPHTIDFAKLPRIKSQHTVVNDVRKSKGVNQHNYLVHHGGKYWAMWSDGPGVEDRVGQRVKFATSPDGLTWSEPKFLTPIPPNSGPDSEHYNTRTTKGWRWISRGFWQRDGELLALASLDEAAGFFGPGLELHAFRLNPDDETWEDQGVMYDNAINNFPPQKIPTGQWMMSRRPYNYKKAGVQFLVGGVKGIDQWESFPVLGSSSELSAEEPFWWQLPDGNLMALFRDNRRSGFLYRSFSVDNGRTWSRPTKTDFPDATSKINGLRLKDGRYVLVSNANPKKRDPLVLSISDDGLVFNRMGYLIGGRRIDYPHVIEQDGHLLVAFSGGKQSVEVLKIRLADLDGFVNEGEE